MVSLAIASGSFLLVSIVTFLNFYRQSPTLSKKRDEGINRILKNHIMHNPPLTASGLLNLLTDELGFPRLKLVLAEVEPNGFKKSMIFFGIATLIALLSIILPENILTILPYKWIPGVIWSLIFSVGIFFFIDDSRFYYHLYKMERLIDNK
ncbi:MAG: hypothetical protein HY805_10225 [Nitrospirae bacterium]|nr:hypothetical protein [Nitrospirota bacterium]